MSPTTGCFSLRSRLAAASALLVSCTPALAFYDGAIQYVQHQTLYSAPDELADSGFGYAVAVSGDRLAVASRYTSCPPPSTAHCGRVSLLSNVAGQWTQEAVLTPPDGVTNFGTSIGLDGDWLIVGATGGASVFLYQRQVSGTTVTWVSVALDTSSVNQGSLGTAVAISAAGIAVAGAPEYPDNNDFPVGAVATFLRNSATGAWSVEGVFQRISVPPTGYGSAISLYTYRLLGSLQGYALAVGAPAEAALAADPQQGTGYVLTRGASDHAWTERQRYDLGSGGHAQEHLGASVSLYGGTIVWGIPNRQIANGNRPGSVYIVRRNTTDWTNYTGTEIPSSNTTDQAQFGASVAINGDTLFVGAPVPLSDGEVFQYDYVDGLGGKIWEINFDSPLQAPDPLIDGDQFGMSVTFDGTTAVFGADQWDIQIGDQTISTGAAFVFVQDRIFTDGFDGN